MEEIIKIYARSVDLASKNKISSKNAWELDLIDHMDRLNMEEGVVNYAKASRALEASSKIYAARVDSVYEGVHKYKVNLASNRDTDESAKEKKTNRSETHKARSSGKTLETDKAKLLLDPSDILDTRPDPLFKKITKNFDVSKSCGLILNNIPTLHGSCIDFDDNEFEVPHYMENMQSIPFNELPSLTQMENKFICESFKDFSLAASSATNKQTENDSSDINFDAGEMSDGGYAPDTWQEEPENDFFPAVTESMDNGFEGDMGGFADDDDMTAHAISEAGILGRDLMGLPLVFSKDAYSYFDAQLFKNWTGPERWKYKGLSKKKGSSDSDAKKKVTKSSKLIDFQILEEYSLEFKGKGSTILSKHTLMSQKEAKNTLPKDERYGVAELHQLFTKPKWMVGKKRKITGKGHALAGQMDDIQMQGDDFADFEPDLDHSFSNDGDNNIGGFDNNGGLELIDDRRQIEKIDIGYARKATKMDVGLLKKSILTQIEVNEAAPDKEESQVFSEICQQIPSKMPDNIKQNVSVPMCFVCLLHLANEKGLKLEQNSALDELQVSYDIFT